MFMYIRIWKFRCKGSEEVTANFRLWCVYLNFWIMAIFNEERPIHQMLARNINKKNLNILVFKNKRRIYTVLVIYKTEKISI